MEKKKNKIKSAFALVLSLGLLCQSFPAFAEEKPWDVNDNIISFREIPDLVDQFSTVAKDGAGCFGAKHRRYGFRTEGGKGRKG